MPELVLGPLLRYVDDANATLWVETDEPCEVEVLGHRSKTFQVEGHFYGVVVVRGLPRGAHAYTVALNGKTVWPMEGNFPPSLVRCSDNEDFELAFGSCRVTAPHTSPFTLSRDKHPSGRGLDALRSMAMRLAGSAPESWPHALILLGDQVYADEVPPGTRAFIDSRRDTNFEHGDEIADFEEYCHLYQEAWQEPWIQWLLANVPTTMLWDDHDIHDDWNTSQSWLDGMRAQPWWKDRITGAIMSYWLYQHLGNLSPDEIESDDLLAAVRAVEDGGPALRAFAERVENLASGVRLSFRRDFGRTRLISIDCRAARVLEAGRRSMLDERHWDWLEEQARGDFDHLLIAVSTPYLLPKGIHYLEMWNEAVCDGAWGRLMASLGERLRITLDLEHWPAFRASFDRLTELIRRVGAGAFGAPPASILVLTGDIHVGCINSVEFPAADGVESRVYQAISSPLRNPLGGRDRRMIDLGSRRVGEWIGRALLAAVRLPPPRLNWGLLAGPWYENQVSRLHLQGRRASVRIELVRGEVNTPQFEQVVSYGLA